MKHFITALQFLTRIRLTGRNEFTDEDFGRSVKFFPLVGAVIGALLAVFYHLAGGWLPVHVLAAVLIVLEIVLTGGLHCDGLMDTMDGIFSGRTRERMLEIMRDSRVGANGVAAFGCLLLLKWSLLCDLPSGGLATALYVMPVLGRLAMVIGITSFPYARPAGMGRVFALFAGRPALIMAGVLALVLVVPGGLVALAAAAVAAGFAWLFGHYVSRRLGGLTGDVYGAITELAELWVLAVYLIAGNWTWSFWLLA